MAHHVRRISGASRQGDSADRHAELWRNDCDGRRAGGFVGATMDAKFHAYDKATGKLLWEYQLNAGGYATPSTYMVNGKQYVVIAAGGGGKQGTKSGDEYVAFALP